LQNQIKQLALSISMVYKGEEAFVEKLLSCYLAGGHLLLQDNPGTGKTTLARSLAALVKDCRFSRIQFTPDLLPFDITGVEIWDEFTRTFEFRPGPVFTNILLADEINRSTPKVQSALLEAMGEAQVTVAGVSHLLEPPFFVVATQNPIEMEGTYPLPAAQLDRFMMMLLPGYPKAQDEFDILKGDPARTILPGLQAPLNREQLLNLQQHVQDVFCDDSLIWTVTKACQKLRNLDQLRLGVSPRGGLMLLRAARALALIRGRDYVEDQELLDLVVPVFRHRMVMKNSQQDPSQLILQIMEEALSEKKS
jgi:MoxR-like ATPase